MSVLNALYNSYLYCEENGFVDQSDKIGYETVLLPIYHTNKTSNGNDIIEVTLDENSEIISGKFLEKGEKIATLSLRMPNSTRYYYIHYEEITNNFAHYDWYDEEYHTVFEIAKQLSIILDRFLRERKNVSISTGK